MLKRCTVFPAIHIMNPIIKRFLNGACATSHAFFYVFKLKMEEKKNILGQNSYGIKREQLLFIFAWVNSILNCVVMTSLLFSKDFS